jgi:hypothetical protein
MSVAVLMTPPTPENTVMRTQSMSDAVQVMESRTIAVLSDIRKDIWDHNWSPRTYWVIGVVDSKPNKAIRHPSRRIRYSKGIRRRVQSERVEYVFLDVARERRASRDEDGGKVRKNSIHEIVVLQVLSEPSGRFQVLQPLNLRPVIK